MYVYIILYKYTYTGGNISFRNYFKTKIVKIISKVL